MKTWVWIVILSLAVTALCIWDGINTKKIFDKMEKDSTYIYNVVASGEFDNNELGTQVEKLNKYWTKEMDMLCISISRKDLQPVSDFLQYLSAAFANDNKEDVVTYAKLLKYNVEGLAEVNGINWFNLL